MLATTTPYTVPADPVHGAANEILRHESVWMITYGVPMILGLLAIQLIVRMLLRMAPQAAGVESVAGFYVDVWDEDVYWDERARYEGASDLTEFIDEVYAGHRGVIDLTGDDLSDGDEFGDDRVMIWHPDFEVTDAEYGGDWRDVDHYLYWADFVALDYDVIEGDEYALELMDELGTDVLRSLSNGDFVVEDDQAFEDYIERKYGLRYGEAD